MSRSGKKSGNICFQIFGGIFDMGNQNLPILEGEHPARFCQSLQGRGVTNSSRAV